MNRIELRTRPASERSSILVGAGLLARLPALIGAVLPKGKIAFVVDERLAAKLAPLKAALRRSRWSASWCALRGGEAAKSQDGIRRVYDHLIGSGADRRTPLVAIGGGTIGDAAGFAAATYFRGIPLVHVPTTLLAQVDSAIGGKTGINHPKAKNAIGAFHQARLVVADVDWLASLPRRDFDAGMAEVVKYALVFDPAFGRWLMARWDTLRERPRDLASLVARCARWKARIVAGDERDLSGRRELLNFGHTVGHALESASGYRLRHGEAVSWGMRAAVELSKRRGWLRSGAQLAQALLARLPSPGWPEGLRERDLLAPMRHDKKTRAGRNVFVLLRELGRPVRVDDIGDVELSDVLRGIR